MDNPTTPAKIALGKQLFFDPRLSGSGSMSCASCHNPDLHFQDGQKTGVGQGGAVLARRTPSLLDVAFVEPLFWDGRAASLEEQAKGPLSTASEMGMPHGRLVGRISAIPEYAKAFKAIYPRQALSEDTIAMAIAAYERSLISAPAPFDRWAEGDPNAISDDAKRGFAVFTGKGDCASCHSGWRFTDDGFRDIGLPGDDVGRAKLVPGVPILDHAFKTPTLRNVAQRAPYMHDGSIPTLEAVIDHYDHGFVSRPSLAPQVKTLNLSAQERADLIAFLESLSSDGRPVGPVQEARR